MKTLKFKHLYGEPYKFKFEQLKPTKMSGDSPMVKGNSLYTAFIWQTGGGGEVCILQNDKPGKLSPEHPMLQGHTGSILDIDWYPFDDSFLATASMDNSIKIWQVPENFSKHITEEQSTLYGHEKKVNLIQWNQTASWLLASGSHDSTVRIWDVTKGDGVFTSQVNAQAPTSLEWNFDGSLIGSTWNDKKYRIVDPRSTKVVSEFEAHPGTKPQRFCWLGDTGYYITLGFSKSYEREYMFWDAKKPDQALATKTLDQGSGVMLPTFDNDLKVLYICGKGDSGIKYFEFQDGGLHFLNTYSSTTPGKGYSFFPKRAVDVTKCEVMKAIKLEEKALEFVGFVAPRKSPAFQEDLFPDCPGLEAALNTEAWVSGKTSAPKTQSMKPENMPTKKEVTQVKFTQKEKPQTKSDDPVAQLEQKCITLQEEVEKLQEQLKERDEKIETLEGIVKELQKGQ